MRPYDCTHIRLLDIYYIGPQSLLSLRGGHAFSVRVIAIVLYHSHYWGDGCSRLVWTCLDSQSSCVSSTSLSSTIFSSLFSPSLVFGCSDSRLTFLSTVAVAVFFSQPPVLLLLFPFILFFLFPGVPAFSTCSSLNVLG